MKQKFLLKSIAYQARISLATVDRVIHNRGKVKHETAQRVRDAVKELERQSETSLLVGKRFTIDVVMEAPKRFSKAVQKAFEVEMPGMSPASFHCRFHLGETIPVQNIISLLHQIRRRGSHGLILKVPNLPEINNIVQKIVASGIPVVTFVTDLQHSNRLAYIGIDNKKAGETAAYMLQKFLGTKSGKILVALSSNNFQGEEERELGFRSVFLKHPTHFEIIKISEGHGSDVQTGDLTSNLLKIEKNIIAVYSIGGGNKAILENLKRTRQPCKFFIAHDLDMDNTKLLQRGEITAVIFHDLRHDARSTCQLILQYHGLLPNDFIIAPSQIGLATPFNIPN